MSIVNLKIILWKSKSRHANTQLKAWGVGGIFIVTEMAIFTLQTDYSSEMGYPFDISRQIGNTS